jgi:curved DNA-binding protein CbpA
LASRTRNQTHRRSRAMSTLYDVLGVAPDADDAVIRQTFRELAKAYHPDVHGGDGPAGQSFRKMTAAYAVLKHAKTRAAYDARLALAHRLSRQKKVRELVFCALAAVISFGMVSGILLYRHAPASAFAANDSERHRADMLQIWRSELNKSDAALERAASPPSNLKTTPPASIARAENPDPPPVTTADAALAEALITAGIAQHEPESAAHDPAPQAETIWKSFGQATQIPTTDIRVWARATDLGLSGSPRYVARIFKVRRELSDRPPVFGHADVLRRPAEGENEYAGSCPSSVAAACKTTTDPAVR